jgi:lipid-binding SYLF domain-containing protein
MVAYSRAKGLYGGFSVDGAVVKARDDLNRAYYGQPVRAQDILVRRAVTNPWSQGLLEVLAKASQRR